MNKVISTCIVFLVLGGAVLAAEQPNIVFFIADDISQEDFGCYGHATANQVRYGIRLPLHLTP